jgi:hypothetical protein
MFVVNHNRSLAISSIEQQFPNSEEKNIILEFVQSSKNGIVKGLRKGS